jgi:hypothetical protein
MTSQAQGPQAQGWYRDPYALHEDRYMSEGTPTKLVRDDGSESYDPPPDRPLPDGELVTVEPPANEELHGADLRRADDSCGDAPYDPAVAMEAAFVAFDRSSGAM